MTQAFDDYAASRDPLYQATMPQGEFRYALRYDAAGADAMRKNQGQIALRHNRARDTHLLILTIRALRNQGEPYYAQEVTR